MFRLTLAFAGITIGLTIMGASMFGYVMHFNNLSTFILGAYLFFTALPIRTVCADHRHYNDESATEHETST